MSNPFSVSGGGGKRRGSHKNNLKGYTSGKGKRLNAAVTKYGNRGRSLRPATITVRVPRNLGSVQEAKYHNPSIAVEHPGANYMEWKILQNTAGGDQTYLNAIAGGTAVTNRIGNKIHVKKVVCKLSMRFLANNAYDPATVQHYQKVKFALILDMQANGGVPTTFPWDTSGQDELDFMAFTKSDNTRFRILKTKTLERRPMPLVNPAGTNYTLPADLQECVLKHKFASDGLVMTYDSGAAGTPRDNALYLVCCSNFNQGSWDITSTSRVYFKG